MRFPGPVLITGSNGGLGSTIVGGLLDAGATDIVCHTHNEAETISEVLRQRGLDPEHHVVCADLTDESQVDALYRQVNARFGPIWGLVNLAGGSTNAVSWKMSKADFANIIDMNLTTTFLATRAFLPDLRQGRGGRVVCTSSVVAHTGIFGAAHYCAAKAGIEGFTRALAVELASKRVTVNCLALGYFDRGIIKDVPDDMLEEIRGRIPLKRLGDSRELAPMIAHLVSEEASYITGQVMHVNGGLRL